MERFYYDVHMHLDGYKDVDEVIRYIEEKKSYTVAVTNLPYQYEKLTSQYKGLKYIRFALGFHPKLVNNYPEQIEIFEKAVRSTRYIGEVGLDFAGFSEDERNVQIDIFKRIIHICSIEGNKILSIHSKGAEKEVVEIIGKNFNGKIIMHRYCGNVVNLARAVLNGYHFSINSDMLNSEKGRELIKRMPLEKVLIESDGPFTRSAKGDYSVKIFNDTEEKLAELLGFNKELFNWFIMCGFRNLIA